VRRELPVCHVSAACHCLAKCRTGPPTINQEALVKAGERDRNLINFSRALTFNTQPAVILSSKTLDPHWTITQRFIHSPTHFLPVNPC
jgi:hypothetical protein